MILRSILTASLLAVSAAPAIADGTQAASNTTTSGKDPNRVICRTEDQIGSRLKKQRICMTAAEWRDSAAEAGRKLEQTTARLPKAG